MSFVIPPDENAVSRVLNVLIAAELPAATERVALRLLARSEVTASGQGLLVMGWDEYGELCGRANRNAARRHLTALGKAGLLHYSTDAGSERLYVTWLVAAGGAG